MTDEVRVIEKQRRFGFGILDVFKRRELLLILSQRQIASRYRQMLLGFIWAIVEPLGHLVMLTLVFGLLLKIDTAGYPYPLFAFTGLVAWWLFSRNLMSVAGCLQENMGIISKVYFPRLILAFAASIRELFDIMIMVILLLFVSYVFGYTPSFKAVILAPIMLFVGFLSFGAGLWLASIMVRFRDIRPILSVALQAGMYATPILYSPALVPERFQFFYQINPMYWAIEFSRWGLMDKEVAITISFYWSLALSTFIVVTGLLIFSATERMSVDVQ